MKVYTKWLQIKHRFIEFCPSCANTNQWEFHDFKAAHFLVSCDDITGSNDSLPVSECLASRFHQQRRDLFFFSAWTKSTCSYWSGFQNSSWTSALFLWKATPEAEPEANSSLAGATRPPLMDTPIGLQVRANGWRSWRRKFVFVLLSMLLHYYYCQAGTWHRQYRLTCGNFENICTGVKVFLSLHRDEKHLLLLAALPRGFRTWLMASPNEDYTRTLQHDEHPNPVSAACLRRCAAECCSCHHSNLFCLQPPMALNR